jgi:hypothetical protein
MPGNYPDHRTIPNLICIDKPWFKQIALCVQWSDIIGNARQPCLIGIQLLSAMERPSVVQAIGLL